ncbi:hypothetical protein SE17_08090 [Kouleothrix aurantiaca]|uniref:SWIM-type domain-containing protein n=1 Tax=Kouleothrix aurantiaca TaxID=186479 RepID=A0A0N8PSU5_9CHLR|nr:hypothetical protein SE17_08090 [Kouleothrix aurantiaca]
MTIEQTAIPATTRNVVHIKALQDASRNLQVIARDATHGRYLVESGRDSGQHYEVALYPGELAGHCTCRWAQYGGINCKHVLAALRVAYAGQGALSFWPTQDAARRQHRQVLPGERLFAALRPRRS